MPDESVDGLFAGLTALRNEFSATLRSAWALLQAEMQLARRSLVTLVVMTGLMVLFVLGTWLGLLLVLAAAAYRFSGSVLAAAAVVLASNVIAAGVTVWRIKRAARDLALPRSRAALRQLGGAHDGKNTQGPHQG